MKLLVGLGPVACLVLLSCTSTDNEVLPEPDSGSDGSVPSSPPEDAGAPDVSSDVTPYDAGTPKPLAVACTGAPCYVAISGNGGHHVCGLLEDGTVRCWGRDTMVPASAPDAGVDAGDILLADGALGRGGPVSVLEGATPAPVMGLSGVTQISVGPNLGTCARTSEGAVYCWGRNEFGQLGLSPTEAQLSTPRRVEGIPPVDEVQLGYRMGCAVGSSDRALYCWGATMSGLGVDADGASTFSPRIVTTFRAPVRALTLGTWTNSDTIIALHDNGILATLGSVPAGETSLTIPPTRPWELQGALRIGKFAYVASDGLLIHWHPKLNTIGQPAIGYDALYVPDSARAVETKIFASQQGGQLEQQGGALLASGRLFRWGLNTSGTLGLHPSTLSMAAFPLEMTQVGSEVVSFATTLKSTCVSLVSGKVKCWGANAFGELGRGTVDIPPHPEAEEVR